MDQTLFQNVLNSNLKLVSVPFTKSGDHKQCVVLISYFLDNKPKKKLDILLESGILKDKTKVKIHSYYSKYFSSLVHVGAIKYNSRLGSFEQASNFNKYLKHIIECMLETKAKEKLYKILTTDQIIRLAKDFDGVVSEMLQDELTVKTLKRIWRNTESTVTDFILSD